MRGFKFHPNVQAFYPNDRMAYPLYEAIEELGVPAVFHTGQTGIGAGAPGGGGIRLKYSNPLFVDDVAADFPGLHDRAGPSVVPLAGRGAGGGHPQAAGLHRPVRLVAEVLPAAARAVRQHPAAGQGPVRLRLPADHPRPLAGRLRRAADQARGAAEDPQGATPPGCSGSPPAEPPPGACRATCAEAGGARGWSRGGARGRPGPASRRSP